MFDLSHWVFGLKLVAAVGLAFFAVLSVDDSSGHTGWTKIEWRVLGVVMVLILILFFG